MPDPTQDVLSPDDTQALIHTQQQLYSQNDPRATKLYNYIVQSGFAAPDRNGTLQPKQFTTDLSGRNPTGEAQPDDTRNVAQRYIDNLTNPNPRAEEWTSPVKNNADTFARGIGETFLPVISHPIKTAQNLLHAGGEALANNPGNPSGALGEMISKPLVQNAIQDYQEGGAPKAVAHLAGNAVGGWATGEAGGAALRAGAPAVMDAMSEAADMPKPAPKPTIANQNYTQAHAAAFEGAITKAPTMGRQFVPQEVTPQALTPMRETAARMAVGTPEDQAMVQAATNPKAPLPAIKAGEGIVQKSLNDLESQVIPIRAKLASTPVNPTPLIQWLQSKITPTMDAADEGVIRNYQMRASRATTMDEIFNFKKSIDTETSGQYGQTPIKEGSTSVSNQIANDFSHKVREFAYDNLQQASGMDISSLKLQESGLMKTLGSLQAKYSTLSQAEADFHAPSSWKSKMGTAANIIQSPKTTITQNLLRESPATPTANLLSKSLADLPEAKSLPAPPPTGPNSPIPPTMVRPQLGRGAIVTPPPAPWNGEPTAGTSPPPPILIPNRLQLPAKSGAPSILPYNPQMTLGEQRAALMQYLRQRQQLTLPAQVPPIQLPADLSSPLAQLYALRGKQ